MAIYNPACIYAANLKDYRNALEELKKIINRDKIRESVADDSDFDDLRTDPEFGKEYEKLMTGVQI